MAQRKKLKICFIGWASSVHVQRWVQWFAGQGHEVHLISNGYYPIKSATVHSLTDRRLGEEGMSSVNNKKGFLAEAFGRLKFYYLSYLKYPMYVHRAKKIMAELNPDIVQGFYLGFAGYIGALAGRRPLMVYTGGADLLVFAKRFLLHRLWTKYTIARVDYLLHPSQESNAAAVRLGMSEERSRFVHFGVDLGKFNPDFEPVDIKKKLRISGCPMILSTRGLFDKYYNVSGLLKAFALVLKELPEARLVLKYYSAPEINKFIKLAQRLNIYDNIVWVGREDYSSMPHYYRAADVYVSLSFTDSGPVSLLEAMACGCVPVVSKLKSIEEWVNHGQNGYMVEPNDIEAAAGAILEVLNDAQKRKSFGKRNYEIVRQRADQEKCYADIEKLSYELVEAKS
jgi:glycosyltransferase involved in cell wall biosynthesis